MTNITCQDFFNAEDLPPDAVLSGAELESAFWELRKLQRGALQQQTLTTALREARELAENVIASVSDLLVVVDVAGVVRQANRAALELLGLSEGELVGRSIREFIASDPSHASRLPDDWLEVALHHREIKDHDAVCVAGAREPLPVAFSAARLKGPGARLLGAVCIAKNMTERRQVERALREQLDRVRSQRETTRALATPVLRVWDKVLVLPIVGALDSARVADMLDGLLRAVTESRSSFVIVDLTGVKRVDVQTADHLHRLTGAVALLGARCLVSGLTPSVAQRVNALGADLRDLVSFSTLEVALRHAIGRMGEFAGARQAAR